MVQVHLKKGKVVEISRSAAAQGAGRGENAWFKIAPPSGEFRWVASKYLGED